MPASWIRGRLELPKGIVFIEPVQKETSPSEQEALLGLWQCYAVTVSGRIFATTFLRA